MKSAIIGVGVIGKVHIEVLKQLNKSIVAICDIDMDRCREVNDCFNINALIFDNYIEMLDKVKPDIVHICTPHYLHAEMIINALNRNINVLCEKPLCIKDEEIKAIIESEKKSKAQLGVCFQNRYNEEIKFIKEYLSDKKVLSGFASVAWNRDDKYYNQASWRGKKETEGGGVLINQAIHTLDLMQWLCGFPNEIIANISTNINNVDVEDTASVICSNGGDFTFFATNCSKITLPVYVVLKTENETISIIPNQVIINHNIFNFEKKNTYGKICYGSGHLPLILDFYDCIETGRKFEINGNESAKVVKLVLSAYKSNGKKFIIREQNL